MTKDLTVRVAGFISHVSSEHDCDMDTCIINLETFKSLQVSLSPLMLSYHSERMYMNNDSPKRGIYCIRV